MKHFGIFLACVGVFLIQTTHAEVTAIIPKATIDGTEPGWSALEQKDFAKVNCPTDTLTWTNGMIHCTGQPIGVLRSQNIYTNFEMIAQWRHLEKGGNSGFYVWATPESIAGLEKGINAPFPRGIEVQVLDHGYKEKYEKET